VKCLRKKGLIWGIFFKALGFFLAGIMVSMALLADVGTLSYFTANIQKTMVVQAASEKDIIADFYAANKGNTVTKVDVNPDVLVIKKSQNLKYDPMVYFSVRDISSDQDIKPSDYIQHINPIRLSEYEHIVPIRIKYDPKNVSDDYNPDDTVSVEITLKYLNEFISSPVKVKFTYQYLKTGQKNSDLDLSQWLKTHIVEYVENLSKQISWGYALSSNRAKRFEIPGSNILTEDNLDIGEQTDVECHILQYIPYMPKFTLARARIKEIKNPFNRPELDKEQIVLIDIIAPGLRDYMNSLYDFIEQMVAILNQKLKEIQELHLAIQNMNFQIEEMTVKQAELEQQNATLLEEVQKRDKQIRELEDSVDELESKNNKLEDTIEKLDSSNADLRAENERLRKIIEELRNSTLEPDPQPVDTEIPPPVEDLPQDGYPEQQLEEQAPGDSVQEQPSDSVNEKPKPEEKPREQGTEDPESELPSEPEEKTPPSEEEELKSEEPHNTEDETKEQDSRNEVGHGDLEAPDETNSDKQPESGQSEEETEEQTASIPGEEEPLDKEDIAGEITDKYEPVTDDNQTYNEEETGKPDSEATEEQVELSPQVLGESVKDQLKETYGKLANGDNSIIQKAPG